MNDGIVIEKKTMNRLEFAARVGISRATLDRKLAAGEVPHSRIGFRVLFTELDVDDFLANNRHTPTLRKPKPKPALPQGA